MRLILFLCMAPAFCARATESSAEEPINYATSLLNDPIARLQKRIDKGEVKLEHDIEHGYLASVLKNLDIPQSSQMLVFTKTSFQRNLINPYRPRALYFTDNVYIGWVQHGDVVEISSVDPQLGAVFYTLSQKKNERPKFQRQVDNCLQCHESAMTENVPGHVVRSVFPDDDGQPMLQAGTFRVNFESPLKERWGGWYVTGTHGSQRHMGNVFSRERDKPESLNFEAGANVTDLSKIVDVSPYLTKHSDIVALMVMEYQTRTQNLITRCNYLTRLTLRDEKIMNKALERPINFRSDSTIRRIANACDPLLNALLLVDEAPITEQITGTSGFAEEFIKQGPRDSQGRSLRALDLKTRLFRYPCGYVIYSEAFDALPQDAKDYLYKRLWDVLNNKEENDGFPKISSKDRAAIREILLETKQGLPEYWKK
jgi:hypothetical protein